MAFTSAARAKALASRKRNAEQRRLKKQNQTTGIATTEISVETQSIDISVAATPPVVILDPPASPWESLPLGDAINKLADLKREYDRAAQILMQRQSRETRIWLCWTAKHKDIVARATLAQCKVRIVDGKWVHKDDGARDEKGALSPEVCCSMLCYQSYQEYRSKTRNKARGL